MNVFLSLFLGFVAFVIANLVFISLGIEFGGVRQIVALLIAGFVTIKTYQNPNSASSKLPQGFVSSFAHDNIAIDQQNGKLWLRGRSGDSIVVDKADVLRWNVAYTSQGAIHFNNKLEIHVRDLNRPKIDVHFDRYRDANRNFAEAEEWASRLTTWIKNY